MIVKIDPAKLRAALARRGLSQGLLAERSAVGTATVHRLLATGRGTNNTVAKVAKALAASPILEGVDTILEGVGAEDT
jgi:hypothetical protein